MKVTPPNRASGRVAQAKIVFGRVHVPWTPRETETLRRLAPEIVTAAMIAEHFPDRTLKAVKSRLADVRAEMGVARKSQVYDPLVKCQAKLPILHPEDPGADDGDYRRFCARTRRSSDLLLERLAACG